jgi:hypothetical protein
MYYIYEIDTLKLIETLETDNIEDFQDNYDWEIYGATQSPAFGFSGGLGTMNEFYSKLNLTTDINSVPERAIVLDGRRDIAYYDTLCLYCAENDINLNSVDDNEFHSTADLIQEYSLNAAYEGKQTAFWMD